MRRSSWSLRRVLDGFGLTPKSRKPLVAGPGNRRRLAFEPLEARSLLSVCTWTGGSDNTWNNSDNWESNGQPPANVLPQPGDELRFNGTAPYLGAYNNFLPGIVFKSIDFATDDFVLCGSDISLTDGIHVGSGVAGSDIQLNVALAGPLTVDVAQGATLTISGILSGGNYLKKTGAGTLALAGENTYSGGTVIEGGMLELDADNALIECGNGLLVNGTNAELDLNGHSIHVGQVGLIDGLITNSSATGTLTGSQYVVLNGRIDVPLGSTSLPMLKGTTGTVTLGGADVWNPILTGGGVDIQDGKLLLDNSSSDLASTVQSILAASYGDGSNARFSADNNAKIYGSTAAAASTALGSLYNDTLHQVTIGRADYGDADLSGVVSGSDLNIVLSHYGLSGQTWGRGDFNYDGNVNAYDLNVILSRYGRSITGLPPQVIALAPFAQSATDSDTVQYLAVFNEPVTGVDRSDFQAACSDTVSGSVTSVEAIPSSSAYIVTAGDLSGIGTVRLNLVDNGTILDTDGNPLDHAGFTPVNGQYVFVGPVNTLNAINLRVDTNRDNQITSADATGEDLWTDSSGAIILPNCDIDNTTTDAPDNWAGGNFRGVTCLANTVIDDNGDIDDIGPLWISKLGVDQQTLNGYTIDLSVESAWGNVAYFQGKNAQDCVRIFMPTLVQGDDLVLQTGDMEIIGHTAGASYTFWEDSVNPIDTDIPNPISQFAGSGTIKFGIEGIEPGATVDVVATLKQDQTVVASDRVRVRVAPFMLLDNTNDVASGDADNPTVFVSSLVGTSNDAMRQTLRTVFTDGELNENDTVSDDWYQDHAEIGYVQSPYGAMRVVLPLNAGNEGYLTYEESKMARKDVGVESRGGAVV